MQVGMDSDPLEGPTASAASQLPDLGWGEQQPVTVALAANTPDMAKKPIQRVQPAEHNQAEVPTGAASAVASTPAQREKQPTIVNTKISEHSDEMPIQNTQTTPGSVNSQSATDLSPVVEQQLERQMIQLEALDPPASAKPPLIQVAPIAAQPNLGEQAAIAPSSQQPIEVPPTHIVAAHAETAAPSRLNRVSLNSPLHRASDGATIAASSTPTVPNVIEQQLTASTPSPSTPGATEQKEAWPATKKKRRRRSTSKP